MEFKKLQILCLATFMTFGLIACNSTSSTSDGTSDDTSSINPSDWDQEQSKVLVERRLWSKSDASEIGETSNPWTYLKKGVSSTLPIANDGSVKLRAVDDAIVSESFSTTKPFSVDITMSLNGGDDISSFSSLEKGELSLVVEALNNKNVVLSSATLDELDQFPSSQEVDVVRVYLNASKKKVTKIRIRLAQNYYKNHRELSVGIGRVKIYEGAQETTTLPDGVTSDYVSDVEYTNYQASNYDTLPNEGIKLSDMRKSSYDLTSTGNQNVLVIPVKFADTTEESLTVYEYPTTSKNKVVVTPEEVGGFDGARKMIEQAYFGVSEETGWESLSSYYYKSSGGKLNITGKVSEWYTYPKTVIDFYEETNSTSSVYNLVDAACQWYKENFDDYMKFDQNNDGYFDCVEFVYAQPNCNSNTLGVCAKKYEEASDLFWAFCWKRSGVTPIKNWPTPFTFAWFSFDFLFNTYNSDYQVVDEDTKKVTYLADTHTVVHENGHALGLVDYYSTNYDGSSPLSAVDMMDNNIGDHNAYSKWQYDWYAPKISTDESGNVINRGQIIYDETDESTKSYEVTLRPFESSGDYVIIPAYNRGQLQDGENPGYLDSSYAEYITIEYYTPTGLNEQDSKENYSYSTGAKTMSEAGLKLLHVDSRLAYLSYSSSSGELLFDDYTPVNMSKSSLPSSSSSSRYVELAHRNDAQNQNYDTVNDKDHDYRLISTLFANGKESTKSSQVILSNEHLWGSQTSQVMDFGITNHTDFTFNNGYKNVYSMEIVSIDADEVKLVFNYIGE